MTRCCNNMPTTHTQEHSGQFPWQLWTHALFGEVEEVDTGENDGRCDGERSDELHEEADHTRHSNQYLEDRSQ